MRVNLYAGGNLGARVLEVLTKFRKSGPVANTQVVGVYTHDNGRAQPTGCASVAIKAAELGIPVEFAMPYRRYQPAAHRQTAADLVLSAGFRSPIVPSVLEAVPLGAFNLHPALLPRYRGRSPVNWAILEGESEVGLTLHHMVEELDAGPIVVQRRIAVGPNELVASVMERLDQEIEPLLREVWSALAENRAPAIPQDRTLAEYFGGRRPEDGRLDWRWSARRLHNLVRAVSAPFPGAFLEHNGHRMHVWETRVVDGPSPGPGVPAPAKSGRFVIGTGEGLLEILRCSLDGASEQAGGVLADVW